MKDKTATDKLIIAVVQTIQDDAEKPTRDPCEAESTNLREKKKKAGYKVADLFPKPVVNEALLVIKVYINSAKSPLNWGCSCSIISRKLYYLLLNVQVIIDFKT